MSQERSKEVSRKATKSDDATSGRVVLVGTYKGDQLTKWRGWYNYPIKAKDKITEADAAKINELWLFNGTKDQKTYAAEFVGVKTRAELVRDYGYPAKGKAHGDKYLLFKTSFKYLHKLDNPLDCDRVFVRTSDFNRSLKIAKQLREYLASLDRRDPTLASMLPSIVTKLPPAKLCVCEAAVQLDCVAQWIPVVGTTPILDKIESMVMSIGEFGRTHSIPSHEAYAYLLKYKGIDYLDRYHEVGSCAPIESVLEDLAKVCRNNGGHIR